MTNDCQEMYVSIFSDLPDNHTNILQSFYLFKDF